MDKQELRQYRDIDQKIKQLQAEQAGLIQLVKAQDGMPHGSCTSDPTGASGVKLADLSTQIDYLIEDLLERRFIIEKAISTLSEREYNLMHGYYILGKTWEQVAEDMGYTRRRITQIHGEILLKIK